MIRSNDCAATLKVAGSLRRVVVVGAQGAPVRLLGQRLADSTVTSRAERVRDLNAHVAEPAHADDRDLLARTRAPVLQRRIRGDPGAQQGSGDVERDAVGNAQHVILVDDDLRAVSAVGGRAVIGAAVIGGDVAAQAELLLAGEAVLALAARVDEASDPTRSPTACLVTPEPTARDDSRDLVPGDHREDGPAPLLAGLVDVGVADAGVGDVDEDVVLDRHRAGRRCRARRPGRPSGRGVREWKGAWTNTSTAGACMSRGSRYQQGLPPPRARL